MGQNGEKAMKKNEITKALEKAICKNHSGKMNGMISLSTSPINPICEARAKDPASICSKCYSRTMQQRYTTLGQKLLSNAELLSRDVYAVDDMPIINALVFRLEAFGDLTNVNQVINYFNLCKANPFVHFTLWTKNPNFVAEAINGGEQKPNNLIIIYSSPFVNAEAGGVLQKYPFINKVFTVYTKEYAEAHNININCGAKHCLTCLLCYIDTETTYINELLK